MQQRKFGGRTSGTWDAKWQMGKTKAIRIPLAISEEILEIAKALDSGRTKDAKKILNKLSKELDIACTD